MLSPRRLLPVLKVGLVSAGLGTLLAFWAPYGSDYLPWPGRWLYWTGMNAAGWAAGLTVEVAARRRLAGRPVAWVYGLAGLAATAAVMTATALFFRLRGAVWELENYVTAGLQVAVLVAVITAVYALVRERGTAAATADEAAPAGEVGEALLDRLPAGFRGRPIDALSAEDHYLRVFSCGDSTLIRMRLRDALLAVSAIDGAQTHRSWWVAREAVEAVRRDSGKPELVLKGGTVAPVSRTYAPRLRQAGWL
ncbi:LytTR family DNA-binding domain-containing protein [Maricaulis sp. CAU 1757]